MMEDWEKEIIKGMSQSQLKDFFNYKFMTYHLKKLEEAIEKLNKAERGSPEYLDYFENAKKERRLVLRYNFNICGTFCLPSKPNGWWDCPEMGLYCFDPYYKDERMEAELEEERKKWEE